jgi:hypothetical protein
VCWPWEKNKIRKCIGGEHKQEVGWEFFRGNLTYVFDATLTAIPSLLRVFPL